MPAYIYITTCIHIYSIILAKSYNPNKSLNTREWRRGGGTGSWIILWANWKSCANHRELHWLPMGAWIKYKLCTGTDPPLQATPHWCFTHVHLKNNTHTPTLAHFWPIPKWCVTHLYFPKNTPPLTHFWAIPKWCVTLPQKYPSPRPLLPCTQVVC